jgi:hypothetical protein
MAHRTKHIPNGAMDRITMPSALLSHILLTEDLRQKQVVIRHRGRSPEIYASGDSLF